jgi:hypothetical protein
MTLRRRSRTSSLDAQPVQVRWYLTTRSLPTALWLLALLLILITLWGAEPLRR